ncbi:hypothetical protein BC828DRAFT_410034 [Blastocladiella britannica]|nr:hypothetical protein BC828DRAFT_410034 [Blastocladiella britannica]
MWCVDEMRFQGYTEPWDPDTAIVPTSWDLVVECRSMASSKNPAAFLHVGSAASLSSEVLLALTDLMPQLCQTQRSWSDTDVWISAAAYRLSVHLYHSTHNEEAGVVGWVADRPCSLDASQHIATATFVSPIMALVDHGPKTRLGTLMASFALPPEATFPTVEAANIAHRVYRWAVSMVRGAGGHVQCEPAVQAEIDEAAMAQFAAHVRTIQQMHLFR